MAKHFTDKMCTSNLKRTPSSLPNIVKEKLSFATTSEVKVKAVLSKLDVTKALDPDNYSCLAWGGAASRHLSLLDSVQARVVSLIKDSGARYEPKLHSLQHCRDVAGLAVMHKIKQQRILHLQALRQPLWRAQVTTWVTLMPAELFQCRCRTWHHQRQYVQYYGKLWNTLIATQIDLSRMKLQQFKECANSQHTSLLPHLALPTAPIARQDLPGYQPQNWCCVCGKTTLTTQHVSCDEDTYCNLCHNSCLEDTPVFKCSYMEQLRLQLSIPDSVTYISKEPDTPLVPLPDNSRESQWEGLEKGECFNS
ncbi:hypothetical protein E2C01_037578 [Portunus trituberculatus]|uniref:Uncharacterized protein n=1 Tax=Portunus trituberculatus TaxID=210409 RepID=A0A5B7F9Q5_PORTR|nr:hypothetical protein [Portunus trituberculatus]